MVFLVKINDQSKTKRSEQIRYWLFAFAFLCSFIFLLGLNTVIDIHIVDAATTRQKEFPAYTYISFSTILLIIVVNYLIKRNEWKQTSVKIDEEKKLLTIREIKGIKINEILTMTVWDYHLKANLGINKRIDLQLSTKNIIRITFEETYSFNHFQKTLLQLNPNLRDTVEYNE